VVCRIVGDVIQANRDDVVEARKYSVHLITTYGTRLSGDHGDDRSMDWVLARAICTGGLPMSQSDLTIPLSALVHDFNTGAGAQSAIAPQLRVKGLHPGKTNSARITSFLISVFPPAPAA